MTKTECLAVNIANLFNQGMSDKEVVEAIPTELKEHPERLIRIIRKFMWSPIKVTSKKPSNRMHRVIG